MQNVLESVRSNIDYKLLKKSFIYTYVIGAIAHGYCFTNQIASHDALNNLYIGEKWSKAGLGRFFYPVYISLTRGRILLPWLVGLLGLFWTSLAVYLILQLFDINKTGLIAAVSAIAVTNPTVYALAATYLHDFDADLFALFLSVSSAYLWKKALGKKERRARCSFLVLGALLLSIGFGIYQSYVSVTMALIMMVSIENLLKDEAWAEVIKQGFQGILMLFFSAIFYVCEIFVFSGVTGISIWENNSYNGLGNMSSLFSGGLPGKIAGAYLDFMNSFLHLNSSYPERVYLLIHGILAVSIVGITLLGLKKIQLQNKVLVILLGVMMPLAMNISYVLSGELVHDIMKYAFWLVYLLAIVLLVWLNREWTAKKEIKKAVNYLVIGCMVVIILGNIQTSNTLYLKKDLEYQSTLSYMTRVAEKMEENEAYVPGETPVVFVGEDAIGGVMPGFEGYETITGVSTSSPITFYETYEKYFKYVLNIPLNLWEDETIAEDERVLEMPVFPKEGSIAMIDGVLVVKLGNDYGEN